MLTDWQHKWRVKTAQTVSLLTQILTLVFAWAPGLFGQAGTPNKSPSGWFQHIHDEVLSGEASSGAAVAHELRLLTLNFVVAVSMPTSVGILESSRLLGGVSSVNQNDVRITRRADSVSMETALNNPFEASFGVCFLNGLCLKIRQWFLWRNLAYVA